MIEFERRGGIIIPRSYEYHEFYYKIKEFLTRRTKDYNSETYIYNYFYLESDNYLIIPRYFPIEKYVTCKLNDNFSDGDDINITHNIKPRNDLQKRAFNYMENTNHGIVQLNPGVGKTVISIKAVSDLKKKTIVLVHRDPLVVQWKERFLEFTDLKEDEISRLSSSSFEDDLSKPIIITTVQAFLSLLKRKRKDFLIALNKANIGILIGDEIHTTAGAPAFSECSLHIPSSINFGLSATPYRGDGCSDILQYHFGDIFSDDDTGDTMKCNVTVLLFDYMVDIPKRYKYLNWNNKFQRSRYLNLIKKSEPFLNITKALLEKFSKDKNVLFISERIKMIELLYDWLDHDSKSKFIASTGKEELEKDITFSTPGKIRDGIDANWKDTLIMTSPISNIAQICGRIIRWKKDKDDPIIVDMVDIGCRIIANTFHNRLKYYKQREWDIQFVYIDNNLNKTMVDENTALNLVGAK